METMGKQEKSHFKVVLHRSHGYFSEIKVKTLDDLDDLNTNCVRNPPYDPGTGSGISLLRSPVLRALLTNYPPQTSKGQKIHFKWQDFNKGSVLDTIPFKAALYACPNHTDDGIHSDHGYLETWEIPGGPR